MTIPLTRYDLFVDFAKITGEALSGACVVATLISRTTLQPQADWTTEGIVVTPGQVTATTDAAGRAVLSLVPTVGLRRRSVYALRYQLGKRWYPLGVYEMPAEDSLLHALTPVPLPADIAFTDSALVRSLVADWAEEGSQDLIPAAKLLNAPGGAGSSYRLAVAFREYGGSDPLSKPVVTKNTSDVIALSTGWSHMPPTAPTDPVYVSYITYRADGVARPIPAAEITVPVRITGRDGSPGAAGQPGAAGAQGQKGDKGDQGDAGPAGATGQPGAAGADGADGADAFVGAWSAATEYTPGQQVQSGSDIYLLVGAGNLTGGGSPPTNPARWYYLGPVRVWASGASYRGAVFVIGSDNELYLNIDGHNTNNSTNPANQAHPERWYHFSKIRDGADWNTATTYTRGHSVWQGGKLHFCVAATSVGVDPTGAAQTDWQELGAATGGGNTPGSAARSRVGHLDSVAIETATPILVTLTEDVVANADYQVEITDDVSGMTVTSTMIPGELILAKTDLASAPTTYLNSLIASILTTRFDNAGTLTSNSVSRWNVLKGTSDRTLFLVNVNGSDRVNTVEVWKYPRGVGEKGDTGAAGAAGADGAQGVQGEQGQQGPQGDQGPQGEQGPGGENGVDGTPGAPGAKGDKGDQGDPGAQGQPGPTGPAGPPGADGQGYTQAQIDKLAGIADEANKVTPYKFGNIYRRQASATPPARPPDGPGDGTNAGAASIAQGITTAPPGWVLVRPEATEDEPYVFDCHVYGYDINGTVSWQFGAPNRTDRYVQAGGSGSTAAPKQIGSFTGTPPSGALGRVQAIALNEEVIAGVDIQVEVRDTSERMIAISPRISGETFRALPAKTTTPTTQADSIGWRAIRPNNSSTGQIATYSLYLYRGADNQNMYVGGSHLNLQQAITIRVFRYNRGGVTGPKGDPGAGGVRQTEDELVRADNFMSTHSNTSGLELPGPTVLPATDTTAFVDVLRITAALVQGGIALSQAPVYLPLSVAQAWNRSDTWNANRSIKAYDHGDGTVRLDLFVAADGRLRVRQGGSVTTAQTSNWLIERIRVREGSDYIREGVAAMAGVPDGGAATAVLTKRTDGSWDTHWNIVTPAMIGLTHWEQSGGLTQEETNQLGEVGYVLPTDGRTAITTTPAEDTGDQVMDHSLVVQHRLTADDEQVTVRIPLGTVNGWTASNDLDTTQAHELATGVYLGRQGDGQLALFRVGGGLTYRVALHQAKIVPANSRAVPALARAISWTDANRTRLYLPGSVYRTTAAAAAPTKPTDGSGTVTKTSIDNAPTGESWESQLPTPDVSNPFVWASDALVTEVNGAITWKWSRPYLVNRYSATGSPFQGDWSATTTYVRGQQVWFSYMYTLVGAATSLNEDPRTHPDIWVREWHGADQWSSDVTFNEGQIVYVGSDLTRQYLCQVQSSTGVNPTTDGQTDWHLLGSVHDNFVSTAKIQNGAVTVEKLETAIQHNVQQNPVPSISGQFTRYARQDATSALWDVPTGRAYFYNSQHNGGNAPHGLLTTYRDLLGAAANRLGPMPRNSLFYFLDVSRTEQRGIDHTAFFTQYQQSTWGFPPTSVLFFVDETHWILWNARFIGNGPEMGNHANLRLDSVQAFGEALLENEGDAIPDTFTIKWDFSPDMDTVPALTVPHVRFRLAGANAPAVPTLTDFDGTTFASGDAMQTTDAPPAQDESGSTHLWVFHATSTRAAGPGGAWTTTAWTARRSTDPDSTTFTVQYSPTGTGSWFNEQSHVGASGYLRFRLDNGAWFGPVRYGTFTIPTLEVEYSANEGGPWSSTVRTTGYFRFRHNGGTWIGPAEIGATDVTIPSLDVQYSASETGPWSSTVLTTGFFRFRYNNGAWIGPSEIGSTPIPDAPAPQTGLPAWQVLSQQYMPHSSPVLTHSKTPPVDLDSLDEIEFRTQSFGTDAAVGTHRMRAADIPIGNYETGGDPTSTPLKLTHTRDGLSVAVRSTATEAGTANGRRVGLIYFQRAQGVTSGRSFGVVHYVGLQVPSQNSMHVRVFGR